VAATHDSRRSVSQAIHGDQNAYNHTQDIQAYAPSVKTKLKKRNIA